MVTFDSAEPGTPAASWTDDSRWHDRPVLELDPFTEVFIVAAHPDDETLGAGGLIAECGRRGIPVTVVVVTDGASSHPHSPTTSRTELAKRRAVEVTRAISELHPAATIVRLGFTDGEVRAHREKIAAELARHLPEGAVDPILVAAPWRGDEHPDHSIVGDECASLSESRGFVFVEYPLWLWHWAAPADEVVPWDRFVRLPLSPLARSLKAAAILVHKSQVAPLSDEPGDEAMLLPTFLENFAGEHELFVRESQGAEVEDEPAQELPSHLGADYFDDLYSRYDDPWEFTARWYEKRKRALTLAALPAERYRNVLEIGCSIGVLTSQLAPRVDAMLAMDLSAAAVERARERLASIGAGNVRIEQRDVADGLPPGNFDLIVLSEVGYYFDAAGLDGLLTDIDSHLSDSGTLVLCHWRHPVADYPLRGDDVHAAVAARSVLSRVSLHEEVDFLLEVYTRSGMSVAETQGMLS